MSRHVFSKRAYGDRWPFVCSSGGTFPLEMGSDFLTGFFGVSPLIRRRGRTVVPFTWLGVGTGSLDLLRARFSKDESEPDPSFSSAIGAGDLCLCCFVADRVTGAK